MMNPTAEAACLCPYASRRPGVAEKLGLVSVRTAKRQKFCGRSSVGFMAERGTQSISPGKLSGTSRLSWDSFNQVSLSRMQSLQQFFFLRLPFLIHFSASIRSSASGASTSSPWYLWRTCAKMAQHSFSNICMCNTYIYIGKKMEG